MQDTWTVTCVWWKNVGWAGAGIDGNCQLIDYVTFPLEAGACPQHITHVFHFDLLLVDGLYCIFPVKHSYVITLSIYNEEHTAPDIEHT